MGGWGGWWGACLLRHTLHQHCFLEPGCTGVQQLWAPGGEQGGALKMQRACSWWEHRLPLFRRFCRIT